MYTTDDHKARTATVGFTVVELLIVIVVIAILAAIVIVAYSGFRDKATEATLKNDLQGAIQQLENDKTTTGSYPSDGSSSNQGSGLKSSGTNQISYSRQDNENYCLSVSSPGSSSRYYYASAFGSVMSGKCPKLNDGIVSTFAGSGVSGTQDGTGIAAQLRIPWGITIDGANNLYVADGGNNRVRKISPSGVVTTLAGGTYGYKDGPGATAQFWAPTGIVYYGGSKTVYVSDANNYRVRSISDTAVVGTVAGSGAAGYLDATGTAAQFNGLHGLAVGSDGSIYVADGNNYRIRKIAPGGVVTTIAGSGVAGYADGIGTAAQFRFSPGIAIDAVGNLYVSDNGSNRIRKISSSGVVTTLAGGIYGYLDGTGASAQFRNPWGIAVDAAGTVYVADRGNNRIRKISPGGVVSTLAGSGVAGFADGTGVAAQFDGYFGLVVDSNGAVYVSDGNNNRVRKIE